jgi:hypothetical protein
MKYLVLCEEDVLKFLIDYFYVMVLVFILSMFSFLIIGLCITDPEINYFEYEKVLEVAPTDSMERWAVDGKITRLEYNSYFERPNLDSIKAVILLLSLKKNNTPQNP